MKKTLTEQDFRDAFMATRPDNFTWPGLSALFAWFNDYEDSIGEEIELDVIAICVDFSEYENLSDVRDNYRDMPDDDGEALEWLNDRTIVIPVDDNAVILQAF